MTKAAKESGELNPPRVFSQDCFPLLSNVHRDARRGPAERRTPNYIVALSFFVLSLVFSLEMAVTMLLEAFGVFPRPRDSEFLLIVFGCSLISGLKWAIAPRRTRSRH